MRDRVAVGHRASDETARRTSPGFWELPSQPKPLLLSTCHARNLGRLIRRTGSPGRRPS